MDTCVAISTASLVIVILISQIFLIKLCKKPIVVHNYISRKPSETKINIDNSDIFPATKSSSLVKFSDEVILNKESLEETIKSRKLTRSNTLDNTPKRGRLRRASLSNLSGTSIK